jgi:septum formation inhibitor-activating ATPase MinD
VISSEVAEVADSNFVVGLVEAKVGGGHRQVETNLIYRKIRKSKYRMVMTLTENN